MSEPTDHIAAEARARRHARMAAYAHLSIKRDWSAHGEDPLVSGGVLISRSLVESVREQSRRRAEVPLTRNGDGR